MHEQSITDLSPAGGAWNVSGHTGRPLPPIWPFEQSIYSGLPTADASAAARSELFGQLIQALQAQSPQANRLGLPPPFVLPLAPGVLEEGRRHASHPE